MGSNQEVFINVKVQNPKYEPECYVSYEIIIETNSPVFTVERSIVRRRYSEFLALFRMISKEFPATRVPRLPPKYPFKNNFHPLFVEKRSKALEEFLKNLISKKIYLSSKALHLFLQSVFSINEIKGIIKGRTENINQDCEQIRDGFKELCVSSISSLEDEEGSVLSNVNAFSKQISSQTSSNSNNFIEAASLVSGYSENKKVNGCSENKKVSFCDDVIVAEVHAE